MVPALQRWPCALRCNMYKKRGWDCTSEVGLSGRQKDDGKAESDRILERVNSQVGASASHKGDDSDDWAEYWGRRVGRALGVLFLFVVIYWLYQLVTGKG